MDTTSEAWRAECEARWVLKLPKAEREKYYLMVREHRGQEAMSRLIDAVRAEYRKQQGQLF